MKIHKIADDMVHKLELKYDGHELSGEKDFNYLPKYQFIQDDILELALSICSQAI